MADVSSFGDAKIVAWQHLAPGWPEEELGPLSIAPWGWESPRTWVVTVTNPVEDGEWVLIDKDTGAATDLVWTEWIDLRLRMTPVGEPAPV